MFLEITGENTERYQTPGPTAVNVNSTDFRGCGTSVTCQLQAGNAPKKDEAGKCQSGPQFYFSFSEG